MVYVRWNATHPKDTKGRKIVVDRENDNVVSITKNDTRVVQIDQDGAYELARNLVACVLDTDPEFIEFRRAA